MTDSSHNRGDQSSGQKHNVEGLAAVWTCDQNSEAKGAYSKPILSKRPSIVWSGFPVYHSGKPMTCGGSQFIAGEGEYDDWLDLEI